VPDPRPPLWLRPDVRLAALGLAAVAAVYFGFIGLDVATAGAIVKRFGYHVLLLTFALWLAALWKLWRERAGGSAPGRMELAGAGLAIGLFSLVAVSAEPFQSKVLFDEFVLQSTAFNIHYFRDTATVVRAYDILGVFLPLEGYLDKRPNFYPFLISLAHDFTGYRTLNAYWLNAVLLPVTLGLSYYLGRRLAGWRGGFLAVLLLGSLPLLGQNATGSGMELLNFCMILVVIALGGAYLRQPDETRLSALVLGAVLLAQSRYESALYVAPVAILILFGWWKQNRIVLSWSAVLAPLLLVPYALQNKVLNHSRWMWELQDKQESRFSVEYLEKNLQGAGNFLFNTAPHLANSPVLSVLGFLALGWLLWRLVRRPRPLREIADDRLALFLLGCGAVINTILMMFYYWAGFDDPMAARFSLPLHLVFVFAVVAAAGHIAAKRTGLTVLGGLICLVITVAGTTRVAQNFYSHLGIDEIEWEKRFVAARLPGERLVITNKSPLSWLLVKTPSILLTRARQLGERLQYQIKQGTFYEILVTQSFRPTTPDGDYEMLPEDRLPATFKLEPLAERRFGTKLTRISRLVALDLPPTNQPVPPAAAPLGTH
jgi:Dolichyl-phosphate-mannose-protein mannosyltransferase